MAEDIAEDAYRFLRSHLAGKIRFDGERIEIRVAPAPDGSLVASVMVAMLRSVDVVLELPDDSDDGIQVQVTLEEIKEDGPMGALCDRWCIYHGEPPDVRWARMSIDAARFHGYFVDGTALARPNPFAAQEPALCRMLNDGMLPAIVRAAETTAGHRLAAARVVGVDPWGIDVRAQLGIARIPSPSPLADPAEVGPWVAGFATS